MDRLKERGWHVYSDIRFTHKRVQFGFFSPWQRKMLQQHGSNVICFDTTYNVCKPLEVQGWPKVKLLLTTLVVRNAATGSGTPVAWFFCSDELAGQIGRHHLKHSLQSVANLCATSQQLPETPAREMHMEAMEVIHATRWQDRWQRFKRDYRTTCPAFVEYFQTQWINQAKNCMLSERMVPMQGIHTNNYNKSWHRVFKFHFISQTKVFRIDIIIHILADDVEPDYRQLLITTTLGFRKQRTSKFQNYAKGLADSYTDKDLASLGVMVTKNSPTDSPRTYSRFSGALLASLALGLPAIQ
ncbi:uncharacterized protein MELLADRAFT_114437 [Melampsora larici-populina 98AG31]|uniref:MULE transposase domain-containing protein n=1 Tax=Melampsora larici-populina (strain 98AG31 / pathotype 3-4-7) TaxID=747676 RepID=F4SDH2_MELLP|nr:uncharacterized protein MELLADRAFT_114437 [Melampsora larici-populina 98AG31]EGF97307.1 hypothetical protein MELLADRAFT_114437 [Melampsora larici-populina 98AG31]